MEAIDLFIKSIEATDLMPRVNLDRPVYVQPEDRLEYRCARIISILGVLNTPNGLSKNIIACVDFLLRNEAFQAKFIIEYFSGQKNVLNKIKSFETSSQVEIDFNIVQYKSVPWDIRFNDMFLYLFVRNLIEYKTDGNNRNVRLILSTEGKKHFDLIKEIFPKEVNFLSLFGTRMIEDKTIKIITEVIPNSYWKQNVSTDYQ